MRDECCAGNVASWRGIGFVALAATLLVLCACGLSNPNARADGGGIRADGPEVGKTSRQDDRVQPTTTQPATQPAAGNAAPPNAGSGATTKPRAPSPGTPPTAPPFTAAKPPLPSGVLVRINGRDITQDEYQGFLYRQVDTTQLADFIDDYLVREQADRLGVVVEEEWIEQLVDERIERTVANLYRGDPAQFEASLANRFQTLSGFRRWSCERLRIDLLLERCIVSERAVTDEDVLEHFERVYGAGGVEHQVRHILLQPSRAGEPPEAVAGRLMETLRDDPGRFVELVHKHSQDPLTRRTDGFIANYRRGMFGDEFHEVIAGLSAENEIAGPVRSPRGLHIVQLIRRTETPYERAQEEIRTFLKDQPPSALERSEYRQRLRSAARIEL